MTKYLAETVRLHKALAHPVRLRIVAMLRPGELCVCQIAAVLGLAYSTISAHLAELRRAGVLAERKEGRWVYYRLSEDPATDVARAAVSSADDDALIAADRVRLDQACCVTPETLCELDLDLERLASCCSSEEKEPR